MDELLYMISNKKYSLNNIVDKSFILLQNLNSIIPNYTTKITKNTENILDILILREHIFKLIRNNSNINIKIYNSFRKKHEVYCVVKVNNQILKKLFLCYLFLYNLDCMHHYHNFKRKNMIGIDFEFNFQKIGLCQLGFYPLRKYKYVFLIDPREFNSLETDILILMVFTQKYTYKIMHGSDSLDIPYIYEELFQNNTNLIIDFTKHVIDTRFLCEYFKISTSHNDKKCSLYFGLSFFKVISDSKYAELQNVNDKMGPIHKIKWNVHTLNAFQTKYASYDVIYLKHFVKKIYKSCTYPKNLTFVTHIFRLWCYEKYQLINIMTYSNEINNFINVNQLNTKINNIFENTVYNKANIKFNDFLQINNFKKLLTMLFKLIICKKISNDFINQLRLLKQIGRAHV